MPNKNFYDLMKIISINKYLKDISWIVKIDNELLRRQFAEKANVVGPWIERQLDAVTAIGLGLQVIYQQRFICHFTDFWILLVYILGNSRGSIASSERIRTGSISIQDSSWGIGEDPPSGSGRHDLRESIYSVYHGDAARRLGTTSDFDQSQH